jgi:hypothetical protein
MLFKGKGAGFDVTHHAAEKIACLHDGRISCYIRERNFCRLRGVGCGDS